MTQLRISSSLEVSERISSSPMVEALIAHQLKLIYIGGFRDLSPLPIYNIAGSE